MAEIKVSVIVALYNGAKTLERCVTSLLAQTLDDIEIIFIDDCSTDDTFTHLTSLLSQSERKNVRFVCKEKNMGLAHTRQMGMDMAQGEYIIHCDGDDWVDVDYYDNLYRLANEKDADIVSGNYLIEFEDFNLPGCFPEIHCVEGFMTLDQGGFLSVWSHMIRRKYLTDNDIKYFPGLDYAGDDGFLYRCYCLGGKCATYHGSSHYHYFKGNAQSMTLRKYTLSYLQQKEKVFQSLSEFVQKLGFDPMTNAIMTGEKRVIKEGYLLTDPPLYKYWRKAFPEMTPTILHDKKLSKLYRLFWGLGQYVHPIFLKLYMDFAKG